MREFLKKTRDIYYQERRKLSFSFDAYNRLNMPPWMNGSNDNRFGATYREQKRLMKKGRVVLANIVQANSLLFKSGKYNSPAAMVFTEDPYFEENPDKLQEIASKLYGIKGNASEDEELQRFGDILADEVVTLFNVEIPQKITYNKKVYFTSFMVHREHLPKGYIDFSTFPALVYPEKTEASIVLPSRYWASEENQRKKALKLLTNKALLDLLSADSVKAVEMYQDHYRYALDKSRSAWYGKEKWSTKAYYYRFQLTTALIYCERHWEAIDILEDMLSQMNITKAQELGNNYLIMLLSNLVTALIEEGRLEEAREKFTLLEKTICNNKSSNNLETYKKTLQLKQIEFDILDGDIERGGEILKSLLESENSETILGNLYLYSGIYHYKRNEKEKALAFFDKALEKLKQPYSIRKIENYIRLLQSKESL